MQKQLGLTAVFHGSKAGWIKFPLPNRKIGDAFSSIICYNEEYETAAVPDRPAFQIGAPIWTRSTSPLSRTRSGPPGRAQRAEARRKKQREKRRRLLRRLVPCGLLAVLCVGLVTVGAQLIEKPAPEMVKAERPFQVNIRRQRPCAGALCQGRVRPGHDPAGRGLSQPAARSWLTWTPGRSWRRKTRIL